MQHPILKATLMLGLLMVAGALLWGGCIAGGVAAGAARAAALFLGGFAVLKLTMAINAAVAWRRDPEAPATSGQAGPGMLRLWIAFRILVALLALAAAAYLATSPQALGRLG